MSLPESAYPRCMICGEPVKSNHGVLYEFVAFERDRSGGGTNHAIARTRTGRIVGRCHAYQVQHGIVGQEQLL